MIELKIEPHCHSCPYFEPEISKQFAGPLLYEGIITCKNSNLCNHVRMFVKLNKEEQKND